MTAAPPTAAPAEQKPVGRSEEPQSAISVCKLVTTEEVGAIQGATITEAKSSAGPSSGLAVSQCYYSSKEPNMSVSLAVIQSTAKSVNRSEARDYWTSTFGRFAQGQSPSEDEKKARDGKPGEKREEEERRTPPKKIDGVGEEAYWTGNRFGGALHVFKNNLIIRVSVGGPDNEEVKINKSKAIAEKAIGRL